MSFAGLKTAVARAAEAEALTDARMANICASFQAAIVDVLSEKARRALEDFNPGNPGVPSHRPDLTSPPLHPAASAV